MRILLIEDDDSLCQSLPFQLRQEGFEVDVCQDGEEGLLFAWEQIHDLILLDRMLPGLDGMEVLSRMRREGITTPVIFLTALGQVSDRTQGLNLGADDYIDCWYMRLSHDPVDTPLQQFYDHEFGDAYMADRFQSMTIVPSDAVRGSKGDEAGPGVHRPRQRSGRHALGGRPFRLLGAGRELPPR